MLGRNRDRLAEAELECFVGAGRGLAFGLVRDDDHRLPGFAHEIGEGPVVGCHARAHVHQEEDSVGVADRGFGLRPHAARSGLCASHSSKPAVSTMPNVEIAETRLAHAAVARHSRRVVDERNAPADQPVEERRLAHIGAADNGDERAHRRTSRNDRIRIRPRLSRPGPGIIWIAAWSPSICSGGRRRGPVPGCVGRPRVWPCAAARSSGFAGCVSRSEWGRSNSSAAAAVRRTGRPAHPRETADAASPWSGVCFSSNAFSLSSEREAKAAQRATGNEQTEATGASA